ncbi:LamG-like jellyroll fold domain-containing protein [Kribbella sp. NPDC056951]|uniref:LamG-like jellyroll fold domain-containing protein n=1 Tax=Kribbella sp. NPDC056951 TaxID=3345978 RepID=UPI0036436162
MPMSRLSSRARKRRIRIAQAVAIAAALAVPLAGIGPAAPVTVAAAAVPPVPPAAMSGKGEASAPKQQLGSGKLPAAVPGGNKVKPPSLRSRFPVGETKPEDAASEQPAPKPAEALPSDQAPVKGFDAKTSREVPGKRDRFTQTFTNADSTETTVTSVAPLNFQKADGSWAQINANLQPADPGGWETISTEVYSWMAPHADADPVARIDLGDGRSIGWGVSGASAVAGQMSGSTVIYPGFLPNADLELVSQPRGIKETVILNSPAAARSYTFPLSLSNLTAALQGREIVLKDVDGIERARIPAGTMEDSNTTQVRATSNAVTYELLTVNGRQTLKVTADDAWLDDPARVYPVRIDPTVIPTDRATAGRAVSAGLNGAISGASDLQIGCRPPAGGANCSSTSGWNAYTTLLDFPILERAPFMYDTIVAAQLEVYNYKADTCAARDLDVYGVTQNWRETPLDQIKYPGPATGRSILAAKGFSRGYVGSNATTACAPRYDALPFNAAGLSWLQGIVDDRISNYGFALFARQRADKYSWKTLVGTGGANPPKLAITHSPYHAAYAFRAQKPADYVTQDKDGKFPMTITNLGGRTWIPSDDYMSYRVFKNGQAVSVNQLQTPVTTSVPHGGKINLDVNVGRLAGTPAGVDYQIEFSMVHRDTTVRRWYTDWGVRPAARLITVQNVPPVVDVGKVWPLNGAQAYTLTPPLWAGGIDPDQPESTLKYKFSVCEVVGTNTQVGCFDSGAYSTMKGWAVPAGKLGWNREYQWKVSVQDNDGAVTTGPAVTLFTDVPQPSITSHIANNDGKSQDKPYDPAVGNYTASALDIVVPVAGPELNVARTYNSLDPRRDGAFGAGWSSRYDMRLVTEDNDNVLVTYPDGRQVRFGKNADGTFAAPRGTKTVLTATSATGPWTLQIAAGMKYEFAAGTGRLSKIYKTLGKPLTLSYRANGTLETAASQDGAGRKLTFTWTSDNKHVASVSTQPVGGTPLTWTYEYTGDVLTKSCNAEQKCTTYGSQAGSHYRSAVLDTKPDGYFRLADDGAGDNDATNEIDVTGTGDFGTYAGVEFSQDSPLAGVGDADKSVKFNGTASVGLPNGLATRSRDETIEMWFKTPGGTTGQPLLGYQVGKLGTSTTGGMPVLYVGSDGKLRGQFWHGSAVPMTSTVTVNDNQWHHVVLSAMGSKQNLYLDGVAQQTLTQSIVDHSRMPVNQVGAAVAAAPGSWPGYGTQAATKFNGQIDEVAIYSHPLTFKEIQTHYQQGRNAADQLTSITSAGGRTTAEVEYNPAKDRVKKYIDQNGGDWTIDDPEVIANDKDMRRLVEVTGPGRTSYMYEYDALGGWLLRTGRPLGETTRQPWDAESTPSWGDGKGYGIRSYTHDKTGQLTKVTSESGGEVSMTYDARGNVASTKTCRGLGGTDCRTEYSAYHSLASWPPLDPRWDKLYQFRDGRSASATDTTYVREQILTVNGDVALEKRPDGGQTEYTYTSGTEVGPDGKTMPPGLLKLVRVKVNSTVNSDTQYAYDGNGQLAKLTAPSGLVTNYSYDEIGRKKTETQVSDTYPAGVTSTYTYDKMSRITSVTGPVTTDAVTGEQHQQKAELEYDDDGNVLKTTARDLKTTDEPRVSTMEYDDRNRISRAIDANGNESQQGYDAAGNRTWSEDANGNRFEYKFTDLNMPTEVWDMNQPVDPNNPPTDEPREGVDYKVRSKTQYDTAGRKVAEVDAMGRVVAYSYNADDSLQKRKLLGFHDPDGSTRDVVLEDNTYDAAGNRIKSITDNGKSTTTYTIDKVGRVSIEITDPAGLKRKTTSTRDLAGNVTRQETTGEWSNADIAGPTAVTEATSFVFDAAGRRVSQTVENASGNLLTSWTYDQRGLATSSTSPRGNVSGAVKADFTTTSSFDELGRLVKTVAPKVKAESNGGSPADVQPTATVGYGAFGQATSSKDALGNVVKSSFDKLGRQIEVAAPSYTPPGGSALTPKTAFRYDAVGNLLEQIDERGNATRFTYDHLNQRVQIDAPGTTNDERVISKSTYTPNGDVESTTDALGAVTRLTYDDLDRVVTSTAVERKPSTANFVTRLTYDDMDNVVKAQAPSGASATSAYDTLGQLIQSTDPNNVVTRFGYDYAGRQVRTSDALGRSSVAAYDKAGQLITSKTLNASNAALGTTILAYDADGNLKSSTPASGNRATTYTYDALRRLTAQVDPVNATDSINISYGYDAAGNRTRYTDGRGNSTVYTLNTLGLPEKVIEPSTTTHPAAADRTWTASYDVAGNAVSLLSPGGVVRNRTFDAAGRLSKEEGTGAEASTATRDLTYDLVGRVATTSSLDGVNTYNYNDRGMLLRADGPSGTSTHGYNPDGQLTQRIDAAGTADFTYTNGRPATATDPVTRTLQTLGYNAAGQLSTIDYGSARIRTIGYDPFGRMNSDVLKAGTTSVASITYGYDPDNNVTSKKTTGVAGAGDNTYTYDQLGRLTTWTKGTTSTQYGWDNASNRTKVGTKLATYDERNRLLNDGTSTYTYSPRGALLSKVTTEGGTTTTEAFTFDAFDRMIRTADRDFTYDALDRPVQAGTARMRYAGFSDEVVTDGTQSFGRSASDGLLSIGYETTKRLVLSDRHGDAIAGFDPTDTTLSTGLPDTRTFDPFGNSTNATGLKYRIGYQGDWTDPRSGDVNQGARWYDPGTGTFNSRDTVSYAAGVSSALPNLYAYASANPVTMNDPDGHRAVDPEGGELKKVCNWEKKWIVDGYQWIYTCHYEDKGPGPGNDCKKTGTCDGTCDGKGKGETSCGGGDGDGGGGGGGNGDGGGKGGGGGGHKPKKPCNTPACLAQRQRERIEHDAKTNPQAPPGNPLCTNGNAYLCPQTVGQPTTVVGPQNDLTDETGDYSDTLYQQTLNQTGSVVGTVGTTGSYNWFSMGMLPGSDPIGVEHGGGGTVASGGGGFRGGGGGSLPAPNWGTPAEFWGGLLGGTSILYLIAKGGGGSSGAGSGSNSGAAAQPPGDDGDGDLGPKWKPQSDEKICGSSGCEEVARDIQRRIGGDIHRIESPIGPKGTLGRYRDEWTQWRHHDVVVRNGRVYDGFSDRRGVPIDKYKQLWKDLESGEFPF